MSNFTYMDTVIIMFCIIYITLTSNNIEIENKKQTKILQEISRKLNKPRQVIKKKIIPKAEKGAYLSDEFKLSTTVGE